MPLLQTATLLAAAATAQGPYDKQPPAAPAVKITTGVVPASPWTIEVDPAAGKVRARHRRYVRLQLEIDADDHRRDGHYEGITPIAGGKRMEGTLYGSKVSLLSPDHDAGPAERVEVLAMDPVLKVRFEGGSYGRLHPAGGTDPVFLEALLSVNERHQLEARLNGLYYIFPTRRGATVAIETLAGKFERSIHEPAPKSREYFEGVTKVSVRDSQFGAISLEAFVQRMQLDTHPPDSASVIELDMDHTYKDRGQRAVVGLFRLETPLE